MFRATHLQCALLCIFVATVPASGIGLPIQIDGDFSEWTPEAEIGTDASGDGGSSGIDFTRLWAANDDERVFLHFDTTVEVQPDENQNIVFALDTDQDSGTGLATHGIGAELVWRLGDRTGFVYPSGSPIEIGQAEIGLIPAPTVSDTEFETALDRGATPAGMTLFPGAAFDVALWDDGGGGDVMGAFSCSFGGGVDAPAPIPFDRGDPGHVRIASYNVENDGLFSSGARAQAIERILNAITADVWVFCEVWDHTAGQVAARLEELVPSGPDFDWTAVKLDQGNVIVSRFPVLDSWEVYPGNRLTAVLVDVRPRYETDLLVVGNHWSCCTADGNRQRQADALIAFLRDARTLGGDIDLSTDTPIVAAGDFNLVGLRRQLVTLLTGDIADNGTWGPDSPPDWDGSEFDNALVRHPDERLIYTWRNDSGTFYPGKLDYMVYTGSVATAHNNFAVETRSMSSESLSDAGLLAGDTGLASDHAAIACDFSFDGAADTLPDDARFRGLRLDVRPNPSQLQTTVTYDAPPGAPVTLSVVDASGRLVRRLLTLDRQPRGPSTLFWDGRNESGERVAAGVYWMLLEAGGSSMSRGVTLAR